MGVRGLTRFIFEAIQRNPQLAAAVAVADLAAWTPPAQTPRDDSALFFSSAPAVAAPTQAKKLAVDGNGLAFWFAQKMRIDAALAAAREAASIARDAAASASPSSVSAQAVAAASRAVAAVEAVAGNDEAALGEANNAIRAAFEAAANSPAARDAIARVRERLGGEVLIGGQYRRLADEVRAFVRHFQRAGIELVVVWDGSLLEEHYTSRMPRNVDLATRSWAELAGKRFLKGDLFPDSPKFMELGVNTVRSVLASLDVPQGTSSSNNEPVLAGMCLRGECFAVLSNDSAFFVRDCNFLHIDRLEFTADGKISAQLYTPELVASLLGIADPRLLPIFASLANNYTGGIVEAMRRGGLAPWPAQLPSFSFQKIECAIATVQRLHFIDNPSDLAAAACQDNTEIRDAVTRRLEIYLSTTEPPLLPELEPLRATGFLGFALNQVHYLGASTEDPSGVAIAEVLLPFLKGIYALVLGNGKEVKIICQRGGRPIAASISVGLSENDPLWHAVPEARHRKKTLAELQALPVERRRAVLRAIFGIDSSAVADPFALLAQFLACVPPQIVQKEELEALLGYLHDRKCHTPFVESFDLRTVDPDRLARGVHLFNLYQHLWGIIEAAHAILGHPFGKEWPPLPHHVFDGLTWQARFNRTSGLSAAEQEWANSAVPGIQFNPLLVSSEPPRVVSDPTSELAERFETTWELLDQHHHRHVAEGQGEDE